MNHLKGDPCPDDSRSGDLDRVVAALRDNQSFNRAQLAWLMDAAMRWGYDLGYEAGQRDELALSTVAAEYAHTHPFSAQATFNALKARAYREQCDAAARLPRPGDFKGVGQQSDQVAA